ncbi:tetratricopeptide repeat protein 28-like isoform X2 [Mercenaria mercenaria]|uniref:tetratricopeptide repeat protein 28-like isoform X2 n=1 Tax=Mercenaria mercenaria TaxID=6596 RepID=UPI00234F1DB6|nr:tetratricopeptide repeat protein 28-like isoform X2 [Mercenaria mercenaria]
MERGGGYGQSLAHSFSVPSLVEGSEPISEAEEFVEMKSLRERGDKALKVKDFTGAIKFYNEALEIDEQNPDVLLARATACIEMGDYISAQRDTEFLISQDSENHLAYKVQGLALKYLHQYKEALTSFLTALDLDPDSSDELTDFIADVAATFCNIPEETSNALKDMDSYKKLSEVGVSLFQAKKYKICIKILDTAQKFQTNQKGITMRILLTSANAHSALKHTEKAISLYQECLQTAIATHDQIYQTKALVNIATLYLENHDTHQAIIYYEKLLHLEAELILETGSEDVLPDFWTRELQCGLHLNLSIAYKAIGNMNAAIRHAQKYVKFIEKYNFQGKLRAESYHNTGMLNEILGNYNDAIKNYKTYLEEGKKNGDKKGMAQAYGCLGSVYAALKNWKLSLTYHEQYVTMATKFEDKRMKIIANEMLADTLMLKGDYEKASKAYEEMINSCIRTDYRTRATGMCKLGHAYRALKRNLYSLHFYEQASELAEDFEYPEIETLSHYNIACIHQQSTQMLELEKALKYFQQLVPYYESKIREHMVEDSHCPEEYWIQLRECYDGIQTVHAKLGNKEECLQFAEAYRKRTLTTTHNYQASAMTSQSHTAPWDMWSVERMGRVVSQQNSTVLYYSLLSEYLLLWVLQPGVGLVRFYSRRAGKEENMIETVEGLLNELKKNCDWKQMTKVCENRALPLRTGELEMTRKKYLKLSNSSRKSEAETDESKKLENENQSEKSFERRLYDLLFSPVEDILSKLPKESPLIIIPDKTLCQCPFNVLQDFLNRYAFKRFRITYLPNLLLLDKVVANELNHLRLKDDLEFNRQIHKKGGMLSLTSKYVGSDISGPASVRSLAIVADVSAKHLSHPRLLTRPPRTPMIPPKPGVLPHQRTMYEEDFKKHSQWKSPRTARGPPDSYRSSLNTSRTQVVNPTLDRMFSLDSFSTLTTATSTGTDITSSKCAITKFKQVSCQDRCLVFANPKLPESLMLHGKVWKPSLEELSSAKREALNVATLLDVIPITGPDATKERFLKDIERASVVHIVTYGCWHEGLIALAPSPVDAGEDIPTEDSYVISADDILGLKLTAQLVVLNMAHNAYRRETIQSGYLLPSAFIAAGAQCVLTNMWPLPDLAVEKFYTSFYLALQSGAQSATAISTAIEALRQDDRYNDPLYWSAFVLIGKDVYINLSEIRHAMLDQNLDQSEAEVEEETGREYLNLKPVLAPVKKKQENLHELQRHLGTLLRNHAKQPQVLLDLIDLLDSSLKRLHTEENNKQTTLLSDDIMGGEGALDLLKLLGFHFQSKGSSLNNPYVIYPHWNRDELLIPTYDAVRSLLEIADCKELVQSLCGVLPITQDNISLIIDLLSVTKHAPEIQLKVSDLSVRPLWVNMKLKKTLLAAGFHQIGMLLNFNRTPENRKLMTGLFQLLLSVSQSKSQVLLYRLDVNLLGNSSEAKSISDYPELTRLPSLAPLMLPRNQLCMSTPWLSKTESHVEMEEKIKLARTRSDLDENFKDYLERAKTWHQMTVVAQANESLNEYGRPLSQPSKIKVLPGGSASRTRIPVDEKVVLLNPEVDQRRDYAHYVYNERVQNIGTRHRNEVLKLYLPYVNSC